MKHYVGLDVSMKDTFICIVDENGTIVNQGHTKTDPDHIAKYLQKTKFAIEKAGIESSSLSQWLVGELKKREIPAICIDARKMAAILSVKVNKTDKNDARGIADAMRANLYQEVLSKSKEALEIETLMNSRRLLVEQKVQTKNTIRGMLKTYGIRLNSSGDAEFPNIVWNSLVNQYPTALVGVKSLLNCYEKFLEEIKNLTKKVEELARKDEDAQRLMTIPGVGAITAMTFIAAIDDPHRFKKSRSVGAYLGMTPKQYSSGEIHKQGRISKCGSPYMRSLLNESAVTMLSRDRSWSKLKAWGLKLSKKKGYKKACMAVGRKLAVIMHRMLIEKTTFVYGNPPPENEQSLTEEFMNEVAQIQEKKARERKKQIRKPTCKV